ncbi:MAG: hypothetical protein J0M02_03145 [Planctomycetes bacterium]|nr:hypothetical protein [Planctomycetota bacterium]
MAHFEKTYSIISLKAVMGLTSQENEFKDLPQGDELWVVGGIMPMNLSGGDCSSFQVLLWRIDGGHLPTVLAMLPDSAGRLMCDLGSNRHYKQYTKTQNRLPLRLSRRVTVGTLIKNQRLVGHLRMYYNRISMNYCDENVDSATFYGVYRNIAKTDDRSMNWCRALVPYIARSRVIQVGDQSDAVIIPRHEIFRFFYGQHPAMVMSVLGDLWTYGRNRLVDPLPRANGMRTGINPTNGAYEIILRPHLPIGLATMIGILYFDPYASCCANGIFGYCMKDRDGLQLKSFYHSARIPFRADQKFPLKMTVGGWRMPGYRHGFLVSRIEHVDIPAYIPSVMFYGTRFEKRYGGPLSNIGAG